MKIKPLGDKVVLKKIVEEETTLSGIILPGSPKEKPSQGEVISVGPGKLDKDGKLIKIDLKAGDKVIYSRYSGNEVKIDNVDYVIVSIDDIMAIIE